jgi:hypothetical protein
MATNRNNGNSFSLHDDDVHSSCRANQATAANQQTNDGNKKNQQANGNKNTSRCSQSLPSSGSRRVTICSTTMEILPPRRVSICSTAPGFVLPGLILPLADKENQPPATNKKDSLQDSRRQPL